MKLCGADVLEQLIDCESESIECGGVGACLSRELSASHQAVTAKLLKLESCGLVERRLGHPAWAATDRGREVNTILDRITVARGGTFTPRVTAGIASTESYAL